MTLTAWCPLVEEATIALAKVYQEFTFRLPANCTDSLQLVQGFTLAPPKAVPVHVIKR